MLSEREKKRYHRQLMIPNWGEKAQLRIKKCSVFVAGAGGLGSPVSLYLAVAGVGKLIICDYGQVKLSNLNRQILHTTSRIGENKAISAHTTLTRLNPDITVLAVADEITESTIDDLVGQVDLIVDCLDNFKARHLLNRYAVQNHIPLIYCGIHGMQAQLTFINPPDTPCLWCIFPGEPPQEQSLPALGATAGVAGAFEVMEALKYLSGIGTTLAGRLLVWSGITMEFTEFPQKKLVNCPVCARYVS